MTEKNNDVPDPIHSPSRGDFNLLGVKSDRKPKTKVLLVIGSGVLFLFLALGIVFYIAYQAIQDNNPDKVDETLVKADAALAAKPVTDDEIQKRRDLFLKKRQLEKVQEPQKPPEPPPPAAPVEPEKSEAYLRKLTGGVHAQNSDSGSSSSMASSNTDADPNVQRSRSNYDAATAMPDTDSSTLQGASIDNGKGSLSNLKGSTYAATSAYRSPARKFLLKRKSNVRCALYGAVKTDHPGFVKCILTQPLYSSDGSVIIAEAGAELDGEQKVEIKPGQTSVFTTWTELETTAGVRANLNALGTGAMGESGTEAYIDNHYGQRFGGAVMLSFIQDAFASAANATQKNNSTYSFDNSESNAENMASKALENTINIPPTGYVLPATVINVIVAQDVDFSSVFATR